MINNQDALRSNTTLDGQMTFCQDENGLNLLDFVSHEDVAMQPFTAICKVQTMRDGNIYITEKKKRVRNRPIFREDHSSLTLGVDGLYYFNFRLPAWLADKLPEMLAHEALMIAQRVVNEILYTEVAEEEA